MSDDDDELTPPTGRHIPILSIITSGLAAGWAELRQAISAADEASFTGAPNREQLLDEVERLLGEHGDHAHRVRVRLRTMREKGRP